MVKEIITYTKTCLKNLIKHGWYVARRKESFRDARAAVSRDWEKYKMMLVKPAALENLKQAKQLVQEGREAYNRKEYDLAEQIFHDAIEADPHSALAHTYLGHTRYQQGRIKEAVAAWNRAIETDPASPAATKARKKIRHVEKHTQDTVEILLERIRKR